MARFYPSGGSGGGVGSDELTATGMRVLQGYTYVGNDTNDEIAEGTMPNYSGAKKTGGSVTLGDGYVNIAVVDRGYYDSGSVVRALSSEFGDATQSNVLSGKTFTSSSGVKITGTMPNNGAVSPSALGAGGSYTIPAGYHNGSGIVTVQSLATLTASGDATAAQILSGKKAYVDGSLITGSMTDRGAQTKTITPSASAQSYTIPAGYHNGSGKVSVPAVSNLTAANIKKGVVVGGVTGTWSGYVASATDLYLRGNNVKGWTNRGACTFESGAIYVSNAGVSEGVSANLNINFSAYTKFNVEVMITYTSFYHNKAHLELNNSSGSNVYYKFGDIGNTLNTNVTVSFDISTINQTIGTANLSFPGASTSSGAESSSSGPVLQVYRIWLS